MDYIPFVTFEHYFFLVLSGAFLFALDSASWQFFLCALVFLGTLLHPIPACLEARRRKAAEAAAAAEAARRRQADEAAANGTPLQRIVHNASRWWEIFIPAAATGLTLITAVCMAVNNKPPPPQVAAAERLLERVAAATTTRPQTNM